LIWKPSDNAGQTITLAAEDARQAAVEAEIAQTLNNRYAVQAETEALKLLPYPTAERGSQGQSYQRLPRHHASRPCGYSPPAIKPDQERQRIANRRDAEEEESRP
jgi:hypothetical protein